MCTPCLSVPSSWTVFADMYKKGGIAGINKGVNAVALRQMTNWGSRCVLVLFSLDHDMISVIPNRAR